MNEIDGDSSGASVTEVVEILDEDCNLPLRLVAEFLSIELRCVFQRADQQRSKIFMLGVVVDDPELLGFLGVKPW